MELNVWTSSIAVGVSRDATTGKWDVVVKRDGSGERQFHVDHVVFALGWGGRPFIPKIPGEVCDPVDCPHATLNFHSGEFQGPNLAFECSPQCTRTSWQESYCGRSLHVWYVFGLFSSIVSNPDTTV